MIDKAEPRRTFLVVHPVFPSTGRVIAPNAAAKLIAEKGFQASTL